MKKRIVSILLVAAMSVSLFACGSKESSSSSDDSKKDSSASTSTHMNASDADGIEDKDITWAKDNSGNTFLAIAEDKGWIDDLGIKIDEPNFDETNAALTALAGGQVDIISNYGTNAPLQEIASGEDWLIIGGYMAQGCMPIVAKKGTKWNGVEDFIGKKVAADPSLYSVTGALLDKGYDPLTQVEWKSYPTSSDQLAAVVKGEVDYAVVGTSRNYEVQQNPELEAVAYQSDVMPWDSCCRMVVSREYAEKNPNTIKAILKTLIRAQEYYTTHHDECEELMKDYMGVDLDYVKAYMDNDHFQISNDPLKHEVMKGWEILDKTGFLDENAKNINIEDHIDTSFYEEALNEATEEYGDENPEFYSNLKSFYEEHNK